MGVVSSAHDTDLDRDLAVKRVRADQVSTRALARFFAEARVTAQLDHPGIIPVYELGLDSSGDAYFSMQLVCGERLTDVLERYRAGESDWSLVRVLNALLRATEAIAYAHYKGIIHRDIKPSNIMLGRHGQVYVMDWGLAHELHGDDAHDLRIREASGTDATSLQTHDGDVVGTVAYMPPEQGRGEVAAMGTWSDVYSIGAIVYELLTGRVPYGDASSSDTGGTLAQLRKRAPTAIGNPPLRQTPEVVAICNKAMARNPEDRYLDAGALAKDLQAYLDGRVVTAHRTGVWSELRKWVGRNRALAVASGLAILVTIIGGAVSTFLAFESSRYDRRGREALTQFVATLGHGDPSFSEHAARITLVDALRRSIALGGEFDPEFPGVEGMIRQARGIALARLQQLDVSLAEMQRALPLQRQALGKQGPTYHDLLNWLAETHLERREIDQAEIYVQEALGLCPDVPPQRETELTLHTRYLSVVVAMNRDEPDAHQKAQELLVIAQQALESEHPGVILGLIEVAISIMYNAKQPNMARPLLEPAYEKARAVLGEDHPHALYAKRELCYFEKWDGDDAKEPAQKQACYRRSLASHQKLLELCEQRLGAQHPDTILSLRDVADMHSVLGNLEASKPVFEEALARIGRSEFRSNIKFLLVRRSYAEFLASTGQLDEAKERLRGLRDEFTEMLGWSHLSTIATIKALIQVCQELDQTSEVDTLNAELARAAADYNSRVR